MATVTAFPRVLDEPIFRISVDRYHAMIDAGILTPDDRTELLEGVLVEKMSKNPPHVYSLKATIGILNRLIPAGWHIATQDPVTLEDSEPEPELMLVRGAANLYLTHHPYATDVGVVVEVADSSLSRDRVWKKRIYAAGGISTYWLIDLNSRTVEVYTSPKDGDYTNQSILNDSQEVILELDGQRLGPIQVKDLLPPQ